VFLTVLQRSRVGQQKYDTAGESIGCELQHKHGGSAVEGVVIERQDAGLAGC
jgi:hypothetical protein